MVLSGWKAYALPEPLRPANALGGKGKPVLGFSLKSPTPLTDFANGAELTHTVILLLLRIDSSD